MYCKIKGIKSTFYNLNRFLIFVFSEIKGFLKMFVVIGLNSESYVNLLILSQRHLGEVFSLQGLSFNFVNFVKLWRIKFLTRSTDKFAASKNQCLKLKPSMIFNLPIQKHWIIKFSKLTTVLRIFIPTLQARLIDS